MVEIDFASGAAYVRFSPPGQKVAKTLVRREWPLVAIDLDKEGEVIGIEAIGVNNLTIHKLLEKANVQMNPRLVQKAEYVSLRGSAPAFT